MADDEGYAGIHKLVSSSDSLLRIAIVINDEGPKPLPEHTTLVVEIGDCHCDGSLRQIAHASVRACHRGSYAYQDVSPSARDARCCCEQDGEQGDCRNLHWRHLLQRQRLTGC